MADLIVPQDLPPPRRPTPPPSNRWAAWLAVLAVIGAVVAGGWFAWRAMQTEPAEERAAAAAPARESPSATPPGEADETPEEPPPSPVPPAPAQTVEAAAREHEDAAEQAAARRRAEDALSRLVQPQAELADLAPDVWAGQEIEAIERAVADADQAYGEGRFADAADGYEHAAGLAETLLARKAAAVDPLMEAGLEALQAANGAEAARRFAAVLALDERNPAARTGLRRSATIEECRALLEAGRSHQAAGRLELALVDFEQAARLDPEHPEAMAAVGRIREQLQDQAFRKAMSDALQELDEGRLDQARARVLQARALKPTAPEVDDALFRITEAERITTLEQLREAAQRAEAGEDWEKAHRLYVEALAIDSRVAFAREGAARCAAVQRLLQQIEHFIEHPALLESAEARSTAHLLVSESTALNVAAPSLEARTQALARRLAAAETEVPVLLRSDERTQVDVYRVGRFRPFRQRTLQLLPGTYTIVGHRPGYRDVRLELRVEPGAESASVIVVCRERI